MGKCLYCDGDSEGFVCYLPKAKEFKGNAMICESKWGSKLIISLPFGKECEYSIEYCPMCGKKLG
jgi:hypothetical protein